MVAIDLLEAERNRQSANGDTQAQWAAQFAFFYREAILRAVDRGEYRSALNLAQRMRTGETQFADIVLADDTLLLSFVVHDQRAIALTQFRNQLWHIEITLAAGALRALVDTTLVLMTARRHADRNSLYAQLAQLHQLLVAPTWRAGMRRLLVQPDANLYNFTVCRASE